MDNRIYYAAAKGTQVWALSLRKVTTVEMENPRRSDRIYLEFPIVLTGTDRKGQKFVEETKTLVIARHGAKIISRQILVPQQKLRIRCPKTGREADLRVAGPVGGDGENYYYGVEILEAGADFWGIEFPSLVEAEEAASRLVLECTRCRSQEVAHLDVFELEVLLANECLARPCKRCAATSMWITQVPAGGQAATSEKVLTARHSMQDRKDARITLRVDACIRHPVYGDEVVATENVSRGGFRFRSSRDYPVATLLEAALPYVPGAANIFAPVRVVYQEDSSAQPRRAYGVAYVPTQMATSLTGMRISTPE